MIEKLSNDEALNILNEEKVGRLACVADGYPYVVPVGYVFDNDRIYIHSLFGKKVRGLRENPRACVQVDQIADECHWRSVVAYGTCEEITDPQEQEKVLQKLFTRFPKLTPVESSIAAGAQPLQVIVISIRIEKITAVGEALLPRGQ